MSKIREYEVTVLFSPSVDDEARKTLIESVASQLTHAEGDDAAPAVNHWGMRNMAYEIKDQREAYYVLYDAKLDGTKIRGIERDFMYNDDILRFMFVRKSEK